jgi:dihydrofolate reductase
MLLEQGLSDEVLLFVYPILLGKGKRFFSDGTPPSGTRTCRVEVIRAPYLAILLLLRTSLP